VVAKRTLLAGALGVALALVAVGSASGEVVARGVQEGMLAVGPRGAPYVAYVRGTNVVVAMRVSKGRWRASTAGSASAGSQVMDFAVGRAGPVALVQSADDRKLTLVRQRPVGWQSTPIVTKLPAQIELGWPGLALDRQGMALVSYTRWNNQTLNSQLLLARVDARGRVRAQRITAEGFPKSAVPPPAAPVRFGKTVHVIESYGYRGVLGTLEWFPQKRTWIGLGIDSGVGDFPLGPVLAGLSPGGVLHVAWTESLLYFGQAPVTLAVRGRVSSSEFVLDRALATALVLPASGPEIAANEWVAPAELGLQGQDYAWAGTVVREGNSIELDGWLAGYAARARGGRDVLLAGSAGLSWFHAPRRMATRMSLDVEFQSSSGVRLSGRVSGVSAGRVALYRERPGTARRAIGTAPVTGGSFSFSDRPTVRPVLYRAVYTDPRTGIPYAALLRDPIG
jgi:hypothetical protein